MKRNVLITALNLLIIAVTLLLFISCKKDVETPSTTAGKIENLAQAYLKGHKIPGVAIGTIHNDSMKTYFYGVKNKQTGEKIDEYTVFQLASITKTFTALLCAEQSNKGVLNLKDPVNKYLPSHLHLPDKNGKSVQLIQLLNHTSGLDRDPDFNNDDFKADENFSEADMSKYLKGTRLQSTPGEKYSYSNTGFGLAGYAAAHQMNKTYSQAMKEMVFQPLGMIHTVCRVNELSSNNIAQGYHGNQNEEFLPYFETYSACGTIKSNIHDMLIYLNHCINPGQSPLKEAFNLLSAPTFQIETRQSISLGWHIVKANSGKEYYWHNGQLPGSSSFIAYNPQTKNGVVVLVNSDKSGPDELGFDIMLFLEGQ